MECGEASGVLERLGGGLYIGGARGGRFGVTVDTRLAPRTRVLAHELMEGDGEGNRRAAEVTEMSGARGQEGKWPWRH